MNHPLWKIKGHREAKVLKIENGYLVLTYLVDSDHTRGTVAKSKKELFSILDRLFTDKKAK